MQRTRLLAGPADCSSLAPSELICTSPAHTLIEAATAETFDYSAYRDTHHEWLEPLIEVKLAGTEPVVAAPVGERDHLTSRIQATANSRA